MSKVIGITPGPVKHEVVDREDLANIKEFNPANTGAEGDVLVRAENGTYEWADKGFNPSNDGSVNYVLAKTENGYAWVDISTLLPSNDNTEE